MEKNNDLSTEELTKNKFSIYKKRCILLYISFEFCVVCNVKNLIFQGNAWQTDHFIENPLKMH